MSATPPRREPGSNPAQVRIRRRIEWIDTDAAGIYHWTTVFRLAEAAEAELHRAVGITDLTFGVSPRVAVEFVFHQALRFDDLVEVTFTVAHLGRSSIAYDIEVTGSDGIAASGCLTTCLVDVETRRPVELPEPVRRALGESVVQGIAP